MKLFFSTGLCLLGCLLVAEAAQPRELPAAAVKEAGAMRKDTLTLLRAKCVKCHGAEKPKAKLDLSSLEALAQGSRKGAVVVAGKPAESLLWEMVDLDKMPPKEPLAERERALLRHWIAEGAPGMPASKLDPPNRPTHWVFRPLVRPVIPRVRNSGSIRTDIDSFIQAALERRGLTLGAEAQGAALIRRVSFDLTGLPPTLKKLDEYLKNPSPAAYERMIDHYLASPQYGERWGKYWLEAAGYADSNGYFSADSDRPLAYRYRDYVIRSFNADKPYDQFVREQLAGDEVARYEPNGDVTGATVELLTATHFLRNAPDGTGESDGNPDEVQIDRMTVLEGNLQNTINCLLGITIQCTRCHAHKFEPIKHDEYYRLQAIFYPVYCPDRWIKPNDRVLTVGTRKEREERQRLGKQLTQQIKALQAAVETIAAPLREQLIEERLDPLDPAKRATVLKAVATAANKRNPQQQALLTAHAGAINISAADLAKRFKDYAAIEQQIREAIATREKEKPPPAEQLAVFVETDPSPPVHHVLLRGQHTAPGPEVQPGVPAAFCTPANQFGVAASAKKRTSTGRRTAFAHWVTSSENPLFARVMVNRIWQHHFGTGIVATTSNLGQSGAQPSHPELLDFLASEFIRSGWSVKAVHRLILNSAVYRQSSKLREDAYRIDPDNRLLWRFPLLRLDAEALRDAILFVGGELDLHLGGPYVPTERRAEGNIEVPEDHPGARRRSVYLQQRRTQVATLLELFDAPSVVSNCAFRTTSTVPLQSLALLNSNFAVARARAFAKRLEHEAGADDQRRILTAFRLVCARPPRAEEMAASRRFLAMQQNLYAADRDAAAHAWMDFCQMLFASNAFLYVE